jgi:CBS-domain-containing membrane protein
MKIPKIVFVPIAAALVLLVIGFAGIWAGMPWLFVSLGPTLLVQLTMPRHPSARTWNVSVGHGLAILAALVAIHVTGAVHAPAFASGEPLMASRVAAAALAVAIGVAAGFVVGATHPPSSATALLIALGIVPLGTRPVEALAIGVVLVAILGEAVRRLRIACSEDADDTA